MTSKSEKEFLISFKISATLFECAWAVSITIASTLASTKACVLSITSFVTPTAAAKRSLP